MEGRDETDDSVRALRDAALSELETTAKPLSWIDILDLAEGAGERAVLKIFERMAGEYVASLPPPPPSPPPKRARRAVVT